MRSAGVRSEEKWRGETDRLPEGKYGVIGLRADLVAWEETSWRRGGALREGDPVRGGGGKGLLGLSSDNGGRGNRFVITLGSVVNGRRLSSVVTQRASVISHRS